MYFETDNTSMKSHIIRDPYLPFALEFGEEIDDYRHMGFYMGDTSLLELGTNYYTKEVGKLVLILSENHSDIDTALLPPECEEGRLFYEMPRHVECSRFETVIYENGIDYLLSATEPVEYFRCAQVVFGFDSEKNITRIIVCDVDPEDIKHLRDSLSEIDETAGKVYFFNGEDWVESDSGDPNN